MQHDGTNGVIDCHAHVFPAWRPMARSLLERLPSPLARGARLVGRTGLAAVKRMEQKRAADSEDGTGIEQVASLRARLSDRVNQRLEYAVSAVSSPTAVGRGGLHRLLDSMDRFGISRTVVIAAHDVATNSWLLGQAVPEAEGRLVPVTILPDLPRNAPKADWRAAFDALVDRGARGFKIHPNFDHLAPDHPAHHALFEVAEARDRFVIVHTGCFHVPLYKDGAPAEPERFEPFFAAHPTVRVCLAHMNREHPEEAWRVMERHANVFTDTSWQTPETVRQAVSTVGAERIMLGSDWPLLHPELQGEAISVVRRAVGDADFRQVTERTPRVFLGEDR